MEYKTHLIFLSATVSFFVSIAYNYLSRFITHKDESNAVKNELNAAIELIESSIVNNNPESLRPIIESLMKRYVTIIKNDNFKSIFDKLYDIYVRITNNHYQQNPDKKIADLELANKIKSEFNRL